MYRLRGEDNTMNRTDKKEAYKKLQRDDEYFKRLWQILQPKIIICLGRMTYESVIHALCGSLPEIDIYNEYLNRHLYEVIENTYIYPAAHCGALGTLNRNRGEHQRDKSLDLQIEDWKQIGNQLSKK